MPGTGHSARYKGSISNRVRISPFQRLAEWNAQLLGADGAVPTITGGGGSLAFKKLDASDIDGVMTNPANLSIPSGGSLDMSARNITNCNQINTKFISDVQTISGISSGSLSITNSGQDILINSGKNLRLTCGVGAAGNIDIGHPQNQPGDINIGWDIFSTADNNIVVGSGNKGAGGPTHHVRILSDTITGGDNRVFIGNGKLTAATLNSLTTQIHGGNTLKLFGNQITIGANADSTTKIGFFGQTPISKPTVAAPVTAAGIHTALVSLGLIT